MANALAFPGLFFCFAAFVLLLIVSPRLGFMRLEAHTTPQATISAPVWEKISFLDATIGGQTIHFGTFGYTGIHARLGYPINQLKYA